MFRMLGVIWLVFMVGLGMFGCVATNGLRSATSGSAAGGATGVASLESRCKGIARRAAGDGAMLDASRKLAAGGGVAVDEIDDAGRAEDLVREWMRTGCNKSRLADRLPSGVRAEMQDQQFAEENGVRFEPGQPMVDPTPADERDGD